METVLKGTKGQVCIAPHNPTVLIGKRVNPNRRKRSVTDSPDEYINIIKNEVLAQVAAGADVVDVDIEVSDVEQVDLLPRVVEAIQSTVEVPLSINTPNPEALDAALKVYQGKALVNGINGEEESLRQILPVVAKHGAAIIGLCLDENGIPDEPQRRLEIASKIINYAQAAGITREDVLINCLTLAIETEDHAAMVTLETIRLVRKELDANIALDVSDISYDLPHTNALHQAFLTATITEGVNAPLVDVSQARQNILAIDLLLGKDENAMRYIKYYHFRRSGMRHLVDWELLG